ncbi:hypothetical protein [Streptomyces sp. G1]|uniref:hypothetical protein n=1 Tax=Streptomyces sp. G1 TaxID=361572 RepID=UPI00202E9741|nr:hypothetical protein [Streptomyces sp. G1]MCM1967236.1 hypothetical protein [Streptomyces sp. G1]
MTPIHVFNPAKGNKWLYVEMIRNERTEGALDLGVNGGRNGMEYVLGILSHLNNATGKTFVSDSKIAKQAGFAGNAHGFKAVRSLLVEQGFLHVWGQKKGARSYEVSLLVPGHLTDNYEELHMSTRAVQIKAGSSGASSTEELTRDSVLATPDSEPVSRDPGPATQDAGPVTLDPEPSRVRPGHIPDAAACSGTWNGCGHAECVAIRNEAPKPTRTRQRFAA